MIFERVRFVLSVHVFVHRNYEVFNRCLQEVECFVNSSRSEPACDTLWPPPTFSTLLHTFAAGAVSIHFNLDKRKTFSELPHLLDVLSLNLLLSNTKWLARYPVIFNTFDCREVTLTLPSSVSSLKKDKKERKGGRNKGYNKYHVATKTVGSVTPCRKKGEKV